MSSKEDPLQPPHPLTTSIITPSSTPSISTAHPVVSRTSTVSDPYGGFTPVSAHSPRPISPTSPLTYANSPALLRTPPGFDAQSRAQSRAESHTHSPSRIRRSDTRQTRGTTPSDNRSNTLSPSISTNSGGSYFSSDTGCSYSSSDYLTPPLFQADTDAPPYKPRRQSSESLTMMWRKPKRANSMPHGHSKKNRHKHKCRHRERHIHKIRSHWCLPGCQVAPTAPKGQKELCENHVGSYRPRKFARGNTDTYGRMLPRLISEPAPPLVSRRWSSVEIGTHQLRLASTLLIAHSETASPEGSTSRRESWPYRSSSFTRGAIGHDIVRTVREKLTLRKVPQTQLRVPATITLRRASGASGVSTVTDTLTPTGDFTGGTTPLAYPRSQGDQKQDDRRASAYLITSQEIDSITELIEANLKRNFRAHDRISAHPPDTPSTTKSSRAATVTARGLLPKSPAPAESAVTIAEAQVKAQDFLTVKPRQRPVGKIGSQTPSERSTHEVLWEAGSTPQSLIDIDRAESSNTSSQYQSRATSPAQQEKNRRDKGDAFDPKNATASINEWSYRMSSVEVPFIATSSDSDSTDLTPTENPRKSKPKPYRPPIISAVSDNRIRSYKAQAPVRSATSVGEIIDVISFPPLPRKETIDWYSPLPDIGIPPRPDSAPPGPDIIPPRLDSTPSQRYLETPKRSPSSRSLYDAGIDATGFKLVKPITKSSWQSLVDRPTSPEFRFNPDYDLRRKSVVKSHPKAPARVGSASSMGSSIGSSSGQRRKSSIQLQQSTHVHCIDNTNKPSSRQTTWSKVRPPSICPEPKTPSPNEDDPEDDSDDDLPNMGPRKMRSGYVAQMDLIRDKSPPAPETTNHVGIAEPVVGFGPLDRAAMIRDKAPPIPKVDSVGIYERITGVTRGGSSANTSRLEPRANISRDPSFDWIG